MKRCGGITEVVLMGEEVGQYQGAYKISKGLLEEFGPNACSTHPLRS